MAALTARQIEAPTGNCHEAGQRCVNQKIFSKELGWFYPPNFVFQDQLGVVYRHGQLGERITRTYYPYDLIASYGDSFTHCNEVKDDDTWQTFLAHRIARNVLNFGVAGYGPDQALLLYSSHETVMPRPPIVMLCIFPENINRVVNVYRNFYMYKDPLSLTKPRFTVFNGTLTLLENPIQDVNDLTKLSEPSFVEEIGTHDYWYQMGKHLPPLRFPYVLALFRWREIVMRNIKASLCRTMPKLVAPTFNLDLYSEPEPFATMCGIADIFVATAIERKQYPIIVLIPHTDYVREVLETGGTRTDPFTNYLKSRNYAVFDLVRAMADLRPSSIQLDAWYRGHATPEGNRVTAELMNELLQQQVRRDPKLHKLVGFPLEGSESVVSDE